MDFLKIPKVFFIKGVFKHTSKPLTGILEKIIAEEKAGQTDRPPLLKYYDEGNPSKWETQLEVCCACCTRKVPSRQIFVPYLMETVGGKARYICADTARFCSWWCAARHIQYNLNNDDRYKLLLNRLYSLWEQKTIVEIEPAMPPWNIDKFGGDLTMDQYHKLSELAFQRFQSSFDNEDHESINTTVWN